MQSPAGRPRRARSLAAIALVPLLAAAAHAGQGERRCCFNNARYTGTCEVTPADDETCQDILAYLNNASAAGKQYCGNTNIRRGWTEVACQAASRASSATTAPCRPQAAAPETAAGAPRP